jgi:hypothetical protein
VICFTVHPKTSNKITEGILVFAEVRSKRYAISKRLQKVIMAMVDICFKVVISEFIFFRLLMIAKFKIIYTKYR